MTFHEKFKIKKFWSLKKNVFKNNMQHKFAVTNSYEMKKQNQTL